MADRMMRTAQTVAPAVQEEDRQTEIIDFKMVTFTLGGKDYGIDIMNVKEISKADVFTYVPNTPPFVRGVYNLRGEIISIIDLRRMFNIEAGVRPQGEPEDIIFLRFEDHLIGVIVDEINDVVGVSSERIQPPHPLFGDINIKFIDGVVEHDGDLFIILDTDMIFGHDLTQPETSPVVSAPLEADAGRREAGDTDEAASQMDSSAGADELSLSFVAENLATFRSFHVSPVNEAWIQARIREWRQRSTEPSEPLQLSSAEDADRFLQGFQSQHTDELWPADYVNRILSCFADVEGNVVTAWDIGCGRGQETYSLAVGLRDARPESRIKVWAHDNDLLKISTAPNLIIDPEESPSTYRQHLVEGRNGYTFADEIKELILFEYHDVRHENSFPPVNIVVARDILSFLNEQDRAAVLDELYNQTAPSAVLVIGDNEVLPDDRWSKLERSSQTYYVKE